MKSTGTVTELAADIKAARQLHAGKETDPDRLDTIRSAKIDEARRAVEAEAAIMLEVFDPRSHSSETSALVSFAEDTGYEVLRLFTREQDNVADFVRDFIRKSPKSRVIVIGAVAGEEGVEGVVATSNPGKDIFILERIEQRAPTMLGRPRFQVLRSLERSRSGVGRDLPCLLLPYAAARSRVRKGSFGSKKGLASTEHFMLMALKRQIRLMERAGPLPISA